MANSVIQPKNTEVALLKAVEVGAENVEYPGVIHQDGARYASFALTVAGAASLTVPPDVAMLLWAFDTGEFVERAVNSGYTPDLKSMQGRVHQILCRNIAAHDAPRWYLEKLAALNLTSEAALRAIGVQQSQEELHALRDAARDSRRSSRLALFVALVSTGAAIASIVVAVKSTQDIRVQDEVRVDRQAPLVVYAPMPSAAATTTVRPSTGADEQRPAVVRSQP